VIEGHQSETAMAAAVLRAAHQVLDGEPRVLVDPISVGLVPGSSESELGRARVVFDSPFMRTLRASFVLRSAIAEQALSRAVANGARQTVLLGAGFDTFAFRQPDWANGLAILEVDHPATQRAKHRFLDESGHRSPANLRMCPADLECDDLSEVLRNAGFDPGAPTFFSWLGVVPYLSIAAIERTLRALRSSAPVHSVAISYVLPDSHLTGVDAETVSTASTVSAQRGEPWITRHLPSTIEALLRELDYETIEHHGEEEYSALLSTTREDGLPIPGFERIVVAS
jgi:methyltransferase (TIGR00027 family)